MIPVNGLCRVTFETPDLSHQVAHYTEIVGLHVAAQTKDRAFLATELGEEVVELRAGTVQRCLGISLHVDNTCEPDTAIKRLREEGIEAERQSDTSPKAGTTVSFLDPNGTSVELYTRRDLSERRPPSHEAAPHKIGHIAFMTPDHQRVIAFYTSVLGFRISDWAGDFFAFMRCGPDHHTINVLRGDQRRMHHFAFELRDWAHVQRACDHFGRKNIRIVWGPGRHGIGHNIFIYHFDPDGRVVEYYAEMDQMKNEAAGYFEPRPWHKDNPQRPKVWTDFDEARLTWGPPPTPEYAATHSRHTPATKGAAAQ